MNIEKVNEILNNIKFLTKEELNFLGFGKPNSSSLFNCYNNIIAEPNNSKIIVDGDRAYIGFSKQIGCDYKMLKKKSGNNHMNRKIPIINNENGTKYHIQNINNFHSQIKDIINNKFKGVSSKYLIQYIN